MIFFFNCISDISIISFISIIFDNYEDNIIGDYIYNFADLKKFLNNVSENIDLLLIDRKNIKKKYNKYVDCNSSKRVLDFIKYKIKQHEKEEDNYEEWNKSWSNDWLYKYVFKFIWGESASAETFSS